jgi:predicted  nucleic acid-binding Zn-ribbon protein
MRRELEPRRDLSDNLQKQVHSLTAKCKKMESRARAAETDLAETEVYIELLANATDSAKLEKDALLRETIQLNPNRKELRTWRASLQPYLKEMKI